MLPVFVTLATVSADHGDDFDHLTLGDGIVNDAVSSSGHGIHVLTGLSFGLSGGLVGGLDHVSLQFISHQR
jgi:hypothetical protein